MFPEAGDFLTRGSNFLGLGSSARSIEQQHQRTVRQPSARSAQRSRAVAFNVAMAMPPFPLPPPVCMTCGIAFAF